MAMFRSELEQFIQQIQEQGTQSGALLCKVLKEMVQHVPLVIHIEENGSMDEGKMTYKITEPQSEINKIIHELSNSETPIVMLHDKGVTLTFTKIEHSEGEAVCTLATLDGEYNIMLSMEDGKSKVTFAKHIKLN